MRALLFMSLLSGVCLLHQVSAGKNWALLVSGSKDWENYRHQADICHAYQIMHSAGIPDEQIIVMMYDDIAYNPRNPFKGNIINRPGGPNVYPGVPKDYTGGQVTAAVFYAVLQGQKDRVRQLIGREGKVIESGPEDHIFIFYADHGSPGFIVMPQGPFIYARQLNSVLVDMHNKRLFSKLTFYLEACESGSMFHNLLPSTINVYATTAANPWENSFACYYDYSRYAFLGDLYSVKWMEDTDAANLHTETLETQYQRVKARTTGSHVQQYGDLTIDNMVLASFFGRYSRQIQNATMRSTVPADKVPSETATLHSLKRRIQDTPIGSGDKMALEMELYQLQKKMGHSQDLILDIARATFDDLPEKSVYDIALKPREEIQNFDCYENVVETLVALCPGLDINGNDFALRKFYVLVNLCNKRPIGKIVSAVEAAAAVNPICRV